MPDPYFGGFKDILFILSYCDDLKSHPIPAVLCDVGSPVQEERLALAKQSKRLPVRKQAPGACSPEEAGPGLGMVLGVGLKGEYFMRPLVLCSVVSGLLPLESARVDVRGPHTCPRLMKREGETSLWAFQVS